MKRLLLLIALIVNGAAYAASSTTAAPTATTTTTTAATRYEPNLLNIAADKVVQGLIARKYTLAEIKPKLPAEMFEIVQTKYNEVTKTFQSLIQKYPNSSLLFLEAFPVYDSPEPHQPNIALQTMIAQYLADNNQLTNIPSNIDPVPIFQRVIEAGYNPNTPIEYRGRTVLLIESFLDQEYDFQHHKDSSVSFNTGGEYVGGNKNLLYNRTTYLPLLMQLIQLTNNIPSTIPGLLITALPQFPELLQLLIAKGFDVNKSNFLEQIIENYGLYSNINLENILALIRNGASKSKARQLLQQKLDEQERFYNFLIEDASNPRSKDLINLPRTLNIIQNLKQLLQIISAQELSTLPAPMPSTRPAYSPTNLPPAPQVPADAQRIPPFKKPE